MTSLAQSVCQTVQSLLGDPLPQLGNLSSPCERCVLPTVELYFVSFTTAGTFIASFSVRSSLFSVSDQLISSTGPASNMQVEYTKYYRGGHI